MPLGQVFEAAKQFAAAAQPKGMPLQLVKDTFWQSSQSSHYKTAW